MSGPADKAYDHFPRLRWDFIKTRVPACPGPPPRSSYPQYYFYCAYWSRLGVLEPDTWMTDVGEKLPNRFESARLYYAYTGDLAVMAIVKKFMDYTLAHGTSPSNFAWPNFPYIAATAGDLEYRGFTSAKRFFPHEVQVRYAGDMGWAYYRMYLFSGDRQYLAAALGVADTLARKVRAGNAAQSVWPDHSGVGYGTSSARLSPAPGPLERREPVFAIGFECGRLYREGSRAWRLRRQY